MGPSILMLAFSCLVFATLPLSVSARRKGLGFIFIGGGGGLEVFGYIVAAIAILVVLYLIFKCIKTGCCSKNSDSDKEADVQQIESQLYAHHSQPEEGQKQLHPGQHPQQAPYPHHYPQQPPYAPHGAAQPPYAPHGAAQPYPQPPPYAPYEATRL